MKLRALLSFVFVALTCLSSTQAFGQYFGCWSDPYGPWPDEGVCVWHAGLAWNDCIACCRQTFTPSNDFESPYQQCVLGCNIKHNQMVEYCSGYPDSGKPQESDG